VALQLLRGLEEILMKGATHNLIVRTRTDVALYVLNHKRGHLRDLEESFKVSLAVIADPTVTGQQSFVIDRGEQVHTLEAAKALLAAQVAAFPPAIEEPPYEDDEFEFEAEIETDETVGLTDDLPAGEAGESETDADGRKRKRRRRRRGRAGEPREGGAPGRDDNELPRAAVEAIEGSEAVAEGDDSGEDEGDEPDGEARTDLAPGERRPRRRGRRGGRRRRGGPEDGLAGSISDELGTTPASEASFAAADLDSAPAQPYEAPAPDRVVSQYEPPQTEAPALAARAEPQSEPAHHDSADSREAEKAARRRSTVREKVSFLTEPQPAAEAPVEAAPQPQVAAPAESAPVAQPAPANETSTQPRRAGWWSRAFGSGD
jgi:ribonuclease E